MGWRRAFFVPLICSGTLFAAPAVGKLDPDYFEGRWSFLEESCQLPTNWTMISGGNFVSEDLVGTWGVQEGKLVLSLTDLAVDEETGESGGRFLMEGPVTIVDHDRFDFSILPDVYQLKRCP
ncbi:hypothetical protein [Parasphingorhabdus sp.]|uniref:hypothetical protein n=1 Tax=Parasphingorhabdus sp. TaxID=2709688 RepID=UPI003A905591